MSEEYVRYPEKGVHLIREQLKPITDVEEKIKTPVKKEKKPWYKTLWAIIVGIGIILAVIVAVIELVDRLF